MIAQADEEDELARVNFRWSKESLEVVRQAAGLMGIPYQTFIKQSVFEHALAILKDMNIMHHEGHLHRNRDESKKSA